MSYWGFSSTVTERSIGKFNFQLAYTSYGFVKDDVVEGNDGTFPFLFEINCSDSRFQSSSLSISFGIKSGSSYLSCFTAGTYKLYSEFVSSSGSGISANPTLSAYTTEASSTTISASKINSSPSDSSKLYLRLYGKVDFTSNDYSSLISSIKEGAKPVITLSFDGANS